MQPTHSKEIAARKSSPLGVEKSGAPVSERQMMTEAKRMFKQSLQSGEVSLPKPALDMMVRSFETILQGVMARFKATLALEGLEKLAKPPMLRPRQPTPRLLRAIANAAKVKPGRFEKPKELFKALDQAAKNKAGSKGEKAKPASTKRAPLPFRSDFTPDFAKAWKRYQEAGRVDMAAVKKAMSLIINNDGPLPAEYKDHALEGKFKGFRDCHVHGDHLLIYKIDGDTVIR
jgi:mRNA interferase YafQ